MARKKIGLALGSGAARGLAHIGVLEALEKEGIPVDIIAGTSAGAAIGALYAQGRSARHIKELALEMNWKKRAPLMDFSLPRTGFIKGRKIQNLLTSFIGGDIKFSDLKLPLACVAADITTGEEVVIDQGSVSEAVRASISIPVIFSVVGWGGRYLVDGGIVNPVPVSVAREMGADFVIAVNVIPGVIARDHSADQKQTGGPKEPNIIHVIMQSIYIGSYSLVRASMEEADIAIEPHVAHYGVADFRHAPELIYQGELAARKVIPEIKKGLAIRKSPRQRQKP